MKRLLALVILLVSAGCASQSRIPDHDRLRLEKELPGRTFYLRHAMYVGPFWNDIDKRFLSDNVPNEIPWVVDMAGAPMEPGAPTGVLPVGTRVRIVRLELPTGLRVTTRNSFGPRYHPWLFLEVEGQPKSPAPVILLRRDIASHGQVMEEIERFLSPTDLQPVLARFDPETIEAINEKRLLPGMPAAAVAMAWGWPERKDVTVIGERRDEKWFWPFDKRKVVIEGERLVSWEGEGARLAAD
jgi:hypothetical protein